MRKEHKLRMFKNRVLWKIDRPEGARLQGSGEDFITRSIMILLG
jgi:hypothetical protein